jgi:hypothetical protein
MPCSDFDLKNSADLFLQQYLPALINTAQFQKDGVLIIWWDEGAASDTANGGGHVELNLFGNQVKSAYRTGAFVKHQNVLRTITNLMGLAAPGAAATAAALSDVFVGASPPPPPPATCTAPGTTPSTHICSPSAGASVTSPFAINARSRWDGKTITHMAAYIDGVNKCSANTSTLSCSVAASAGTHTLTINTWNSTGALIQAKQTFTSK